jgi:protein-S-isoprenylcysteine O-methyltransferase Ste14
MALNGMAICRYLWAAFGIIWLVWAFRTKPVQMRESVSSRLSYTLLIFAGFWAVLSGDIPEGWLRLRLFPANPWIDVVGIVLTAAGLAFAVWARAYLGGNWSGAVTVKVDHQLVRTGPYRWVRHPIYSGLILALIGTALERRQLRGVVAVVLLWIGLTMKRKIEERFMTSTFGAQYDEYTRTTGAIVPRLHF